MLLHEFKNSTTLSLQPNEYECKRRECRFGKMVAAMALVVPVVAVLEEVKIDLQILYTIL